MNKKNLSETDIGAKYITPAIIQAGWNESQIIREKSITAGKVLVKGNVTTRGDKKTPDYVLYYKPNMPIAVVEAKNNLKTVESGIQQALTYSNILDVPFVFSSKWRCFLLS